MASESGSEGQTSSPVKSGSVPRCCVCGDEASGFHYGVDSCEGCKVITIINTKTLQFNKYCKGLPVKASKQQKSFWG